jgi:hypothetical protein
VDIPNRVHTKKYPTPTSAVSRPRRVSLVLPVAPQHWDQGWQHHRHHHHDPPRNDAAAPGHVCPGIRIHALVQLPGIGISAIADMDPHQTIVTAALAAKSSAETRK